MKRFKSCLLASTGVVILAVTLSFTTPGRTFAQRVKDDCVRICDTASNPLHVIVNGITRIKGEVTINNENAIATTVTGPVQVTTSPRQPVYVIQRLRRDDVFQEQVSLTLEPGENIATKHLVTVPPGKFLEIKDASGLVTLNGETLQPWRASIRVIQPNNSVFTFYLPRVLQEKDGEFASFQISGVQDGIFGDSGGTIAIQLDRFFAPLQTQIKLELVVTGQYHDF